MPRVTATSAPRQARVLRTLRFVGLTLVALFLAHDALFAVGHGLGRPMDAAMAASGHDGWWTPYALAVTAIATLLAAGAARRVRGLRSRLDAVGSFERTRDRTTYVRELRAVAQRLVPLVFVLLVVQENVEHLATFGDVPGLEPIGSPFAVLAILFATLAVAAVGALVRWRIRVLEARLAAARAPRWPRLAISRLPGHASLVAAGLTHRWLLVRDDPGRAPPVLPAI